MSKRKDEESRYVNNNSKNGRNNNRWNNYNSGDRNQAYEKMESEQKRRDDVVDAYDESWNNDSSF